MNLIVFRCLFIVLTTMLQVALPAVWTRGGAVDLPAVIRGIPSQLSNLSQPGAHQVAWRRVTVPRPDGTTFEAWLFYPATAYGANQPYNGSGAPYPAIAFAHGFLSPPLFYQGNYEHWASYGYFVIASRSALELFPSHPAFADDISDTLTYLEMENADPVSLLYEQVNTEKFGVSGHSMGGGVSLLTAQQDPRVKAVINMAAAETWPDSAIEAMVNINVPVALLGGSQDDIAPVAGHQQPMYDSGNDRRLLLVLVGGDHCAFASQLGNCGGSMPAETQLALTNLLSTAFFNLYLKEEPLAAWYVWGPGTTFNPLLQTQYDAGFTMGPFFQNKEGVPGQTVSYELTLIHSAERPASYSLQPMLANWPTRVTPAQTTVLAVGESVMVNVEVQLPSSPNRFNDTTLILATTDIDGFTVQYGLIRSEITIR